MTQDKAIQEAKDRVAKRFKYRDWNHLIKVLDDHVEEYGEFDEKILNAHIDACMIEYASSSSDKGDGEVNANGLTQYTDLWKALDNIGAEKYGSARNLIKRFIKTHQSSKQFTLPHLREAVQGWSKHLFFCKENDIIPMSSDAWAEKFWNDTRLTPKEHSEGEDGECPNICHKGMTKPSRDAVCYQCGKPW